IFGLQSICFASSFFFFAIHNIDFVKSKRITLVFNVILDSILQTEKHVFGFGGKLHFSDQVQLIVAFHR
ncbi:hypothetical protein ACJX0J_031470, partial [Zea mays]